MIGVKDKIGSLRQGLFAKYVLSLVGLVVFVLAVNGAMETWISYRATKTTLTDAMGEKAEATARRIEQSISELERQISWVTRASAETLEQAPRRLCATPEPGRRHQPALAARRQGPRAASAVAHRDCGRQQGRFLPRRPIYRNRRPRRQLRARPISPARSLSCRSRCRIPASTPASPSPTSTFASSPISSATPRSARSPSPMWSIPGASVLASSAKGPEVGKDLVGPAAGRTPMMTSGAIAGVGQRCRRPCGADRVERGAETRLVRVLRAADGAGPGADPRPAGAGRAPDRRSGLRSRSWPARCWRAGC